MALVEFVEKNRGDAAQLRILNQLAQENSLGDKTNARLFRRDFFEANLVADFVAEPAAAFEGDAAGEQARGEAARLQDDDLAVAEQAAIEQDLRHLGGFSGTGRRLEDEARPGGERPDDLVLQFVDREIARGHPANVQRPTLNVPTSNVQLRERTRRRKAHKVAPNS